MDSELVQNILKNRRENKLQSKEEITNDIQVVVYQVYRDVINYESNKINLQNTLEKLQNYKYCKEILDLKKGDYIRSVSYTHLRAHETSLHLVCRLLLEKKHVYLVVTD